MTREFLWFDNVSCLKMPGAGAAEVLGTDFNLKMYLHHHQLPVMTHLILSVSFFHSLFLSGHGDQRHAVYRDRVCKERRDVW